MSHASEVEQIASSILDEVISDSTTGKKKAKESVKINVVSICWDGVWTFYVTNETKVSRIKMLALYELFGNEFDVHVNYHMLIFPAGKRSLHETKTIREEKLRTGDELELIKVPSSEEVLIQFVHHITDSAIQKATAHLATPPPKQPICNVVLEIQPPEFMSDVRKIMITLIEHSLRLMSTRPNARYIFDVVRRKLMCENFFIDDGMLNKYASSGATPRRIKFAVSASYNDSFSVTEWLDESRSVESVNLGLPASFHVSAGVSIQQELEELLRLFRLYLRASFRLCSKATEILQEMGFEAAAVKQALRYTGNNTSEAVEWLLGNKDPAADGAKPGLDVGMSTTSDMYQAIMHEQEIIIPLYSPSVLYACLSVMDANSFLVSSIRFPTIMDLLNKILTTYYVNKCDYAMHQMCGQMPND